MADQQRKEDALTLLHVVEEDGGGIEDEWLSNSTRQGLANSFGTLVVDRKRSFLSGLAYLSTLPR